MKLRPKNFFSAIDLSKDVPSMDKLKESNPSLWRQLKKKFDVGRQIVNFQLNNGIDKLNERVLRMYLNDFFRRFINYGPNSFPTSFNVLEPFFVFNQSNSIIELVDEEESYGISLIDFLDFITESKFDLNDIDFVENIPEKTIYHFTFTTGSEEINFSNDKGKTFIVGGLSLVRQGNEVAMLLQTGESYNKEEAEEYFKTRNRKTIEDSLTPYKKAMGFGIDYEGEPELVNYLDREDLWLHSVAMLFDIESRSIDIRHVARDENISYTITTDDFSAFFSQEKSITKEDLENRIKGILKKLEKYDAVFDFATYCLALPYYVFENEEKLIGVTYETSLNEIIKGPVSKRKYKSVPNIYKLFAKPFYYLESSSQFVINDRSLTDKSFNIEKSGYWKRIDLDEEGFDKRGRPVVGKTWVERNDIYYSNKKGITKVGVNEVNQFEGENVGYVYVMRQPTHEENIFKVGLTKREPEKRKRELSNTSSVDKFFVINSYYTKDCIKAEKVIHEQLKEFRLTSRREFFLCDLKIILDACENVVREINE